MGHNLEIINMVRMVECRVIGTGVRGRVAKSTVWGVTTRIDHPSRVCGQSQAPLMEELRWGTHEYRSSYMDQGGGFDAWRDCLCKGSGATDAVD